MINETLGTTFKTGDEIKGIILMSNVLDIQRTVSLLQNLGKVTEKQLAVGGCIGNIAHDSGDQTFSSLKDILQTWEDFTEENPGRHAHTVGLLFSGSAVKSASVLLNRQVNTKGKVEAELKKLKTLDFHEKKSCAFMFACCGRGKNFYRGKGNVESEVFRTLFPNTPLLGIFGNGEIGLTYFPEKVKDTFMDPSASKKVKKGTYSANEFSHSFTTIFVMLSFQ